MSDLLTLADLKTFLGTTPASDDAVLTALLDELESVLLSECGRERRPFQTAKRLSEVHDGTGDVTVHVYYPIKRVREISIGVDPNNLVETLDPDDPNTVVWQCGRRYITRTDGGIWALYNIPRCVRIVYESEDDVPSRAALALKRAVATVYRQLGAEDVRSESTATFRRDLVRACVDDPIWQMVVNRAKAEFV